MIEVLETGVGVLEAGIRFFFLEVAIRILEFVNNFFLEGAIRILVFANFFFWGGYDQNVFFFGGCSQIYF